MFCKHDWKILSEMTTDSQMDKLNKKFEYCPVRFHKWDVSSLFAKQLIQLVTCTKCGKLKKLVTNI